MPTNYVDAKDSIYSLFESEWKDGRVKSIVGYDTAILWRNIELESKPPSDEFWVRLSTQTVDDDQSSLADFNGRRRFTNIGLIFVQIFAPKSNPQANEFAEKLAVIARDIFRGKTEDGCVWLRHSRIKELPEERDTFRFNVIADYEYDEISPTEV